MALSSYGSAMTLKPEQKDAVSAWIAAGDNLSTVQKKLIEQFQITMTYRDVRFLVDDLNLALKDPAPKVDTSDVSKPTPTNATQPAANKTTAEKKGLGVGNPTGEENLIPRGVR